MVGNLDCLKFAIQNGATAGYFTVQAAIYHHQWECLDWALRNGCPVRSDDDLARGHFVRVWVGDLFVEAVASAERDAAARAIQTAWFGAYYDPARTVCRRRVARQFRGLCEAF